MTVLGCFGGGVDVAKVSREGIDFQLAGLTPGLGRHIDGQSTIQRCRSVRPRCLNFVENWGRICVSEPILVSPSLFRFPNCKSVRSSETLAAVHVHWDTC